MKGRSIRLAGVFVALCISQFGLRASPVEAKHPDEPASGDSAASAQSLDDDHMAVGGVEMSTMVLYVIGGVLVMSLSLLAKQSRCRLAP